MKKPPTKPPTKKVEELPINEGRDRPYRGQLYTYFFNWNPQTKKRTFIKKEPAT